MPTFTNKHDGSVQRVAGNRARRFKRSGNWVRVWDGEPPEPMEAAVPEPMIVPPKKARKKA